MMHVLTDFVDDIFISFSLRGSVFFMYISFKADISKNNFSFLYCYHKKSCQTKCHYPSVFNIRSAKRYSLTQNNSLTVFLFTIFVVTDTIISY